MIRVATEATSAQRAVVAAHELGHLLGMKHDARENACPASGFIMSPRASLNSKFSTCSIESLNLWLGYLACLRREEGAGL